MASPKSFESLQGGASRKQRCTGRTEGRTHVNEANRFHQPTIFFSPTMSSEYCINFSDVKAAYKNTSDTAHRTPVLTSSSIDRMIGRRCFFKVEAMQRTGSFKFRGALNAIRSAIADQAEKPAMFQVVTHSSGNHAQALALAAKLASSENCTVTATIAMPKNAPMVKKRAVTDFGGIIVETENNNEARDAVAARIQTETGATFVHPSENPKVIAGQGTISIELVEQMREIQEHLQVIIIPVGGGGLASGNCIALRALLGDDIKIVLAEPAALDDAKRSFEARHLLSHSPDNKLQSVADGLKTTLGPNTWPIVRDLVDDIFTVSEKEILYATKLIWERLKICIEPSAGVGVAVAMSNSFQMKYTAEAGFSNVGIILCGGNVDILEVTSKMELVGL
jgi:serine racemase